MIDTDEDQLIDKSTGEAIPFLGIQSLVDKLEALETAKSEQFVQLAEQMNIPTTVKTSFINIMEENKECFGALRPASVKPVEVNLTHERPIRSRRDNQYSHDQKIEISKQVEMMLDLGVISKSKSHYASPVTIARKKDNTWRFCVDFRQLNKIVKVDLFPIPRPEELIEILYHARLYERVLAHPVHRERTAFMVPDGLYHFNVLGEFPTHIRGSPGRGAQGRSSDLY